MQSIILIGMPGVGKTSIGANLGYKINQPFIDLDKSIEDRYGVDIPTIFAIEGEAGFRQRETDELSRLLTQNLNQPNIVLSVGGGTISQQVNRNLIKTINSIIIWLYADIEILIERVSKSTHRRPVLAKETNIKQKIIELQDIRHQQFKDFADFTLNTSNLRIPQISDKIIRLIAKTN